MSKLKLSKKAEQVLDCYHPSLLGPVRNWLLSRGASSVSAVKMAVALRMLDQYKCWRDAVCISQDAVGVHLRVLGELNGNRLLGCEFSNKELALLQECAQAYWP